jgi:hypothetical protein
VLVGALQMNHRYTSMRGVPFIAMKRHGRKPCKQY